MNDVARQLLRLNYENGNSSPRWLSSGCRVPNAITHTDRGVRTKTHGVARGKRSRASVMKRIARVIDRWVSSFSFLSFAGEGWRVSPRETKEEEE